MNNKDVKVLHIKKVQIIIEVVEEEGVVQGVSNNHRLGAALNVAKMAIWAENVQMLAAVVSLEVEAAINVDRKATWVEIVKGSSKIHMILVVPQLNWQVVDGRLHQILIGTPMKLQ